MTRMSLFNSPLLLGFDRFERTLDRIGRTGEGYPPYNIEQLAENRLRITLAVAGFAREDLEISLEANQLTIRGRQAEQPERAFLHRGIAARQFQRSFVLADGLEVAGAELTNGLLEIVRPVIEPQLREIPIRTAAGGDSRIEVTSRAASNGARKEYGK
jgi:HSP20 family molecular chaperone IbpA